MDESDEVPSDSHNGFDWQDNLTVLVLVGIIAVIYGLISNDWGFAARPVLGCALGIAVVTGFKRLRRVTNRRRGTPTPSERRGVEDAPPNG